MGERILDENYSIIKHSDPRVEWLARYISFSNQKRNFFQSYAHTQFVKTRWEDQDFLYKSEAYTEAEAMIEKLDEITSSFKNNVEK